MAPREAAGAGATRAAGGPPPDGLRAHLAGMWAATAAGWGEHADHTDARGAPVAEAMLVMASPAPGDDVLELACGPGGVGLAAARRVGPTGRVVLSDVADPMVAIAVGRAREAGLGNVSGRRHDVEEIDEPDASFDVVLCREGLMFALDPARAARGLRRVLRPGGRVAIAVWGPRERNPWLGLVLDAVAEGLGGPVPPPGIPGPFALSEAAALARLLEDAGLDDVRVDEQPVPMRAASADEWWDRTTALAGPLADILAALPTGALAEMRARAHAAVAPYAGAGGLDLPGVALVAGARRGS